MIEQEHEVEIVKAWEQGLYEEEVTEDWLTGVLFEKPFTRCGADEFCESRMIYGESCECIRQVFPSPRHYRAIMKIKRIIEAAISMAEIGPFIKEIIHVHGKK